MNKETQPIDRETLLKEANKIIREHEDTLAGIEATGVTQRNGVLVFTGDYFLDEQGLPTAKSTAYSAAIFLIPICISFDTAEKRRYATYLILNRRFSFEF
ncbi:DUF2498 family protein [Escherichia coli]|nr:DUF2498 family protein [Escherichia coli]